jgi:hypothetical protein
MIILGIDPGSEKSACVVWDTVSETVEAHYIVANDAIRQDIRDERIGIKAIGIERPRGFGMKAGNELFDTCEWVGRFDEVAMSSGIPPKLVGRKEIVTHLCDSPRAGDKDVRDAIIYRFGGKDKAIGVKKNPGPLFGIKADEWSALAVCLYVADREAKK